MEDLAIDRIETAILDVALRRPHRFADRHARPADSARDRHHPRRGAVGAGECVVPGGPWCAADIFSLKTPRSGGLRSTRTIADIATAAGIPCHGETSIEGPIGTVATPHLACAMPGVTHGSELSGPLLMREELLSEPLRHAEGALHLPDGPGLGMELDPAAVARFRRN